MSMPYGAHETKTYYVEETNYGVTPSSPTMLGIKAESIEPGLNPSLVKVRGIGSRDYKPLKKD